MSNLGISGLLINQKPAITAFSKRKSKSVSSAAVQCSAFGTSCRKVSKFDVVDPLNCSFVTPGPGKYSTSSAFRPKIRERLSNSSFDKILEQYDTERFYEDYSPKVVFKRPVKHLPENLELTHTAEPKISFPKVSAERGLWESSNYYHPYRLPDKANPGPGAYEKHYEPVKASESYWIFKSENPKFEEVLPRGIGPGSYDGDLPKKLPDCQNFLTLAERKTRLEVEPHVRVAPAPGTYTPYIPPNSHCSSYVFNSGFKRGCQVMPKASAGPGTYDLDKPQKRPVSFSEADRFLFDNFKGKPGVGPAHYVAKGENTSRVCSFEYYSERFFPTDNKGVFLIPEEENEKAVNIIREKNIIKKKYKQPFNSGEERFNKARDLWVKKKVAPDPGHYDVKEQKKLGFPSNKAGRFEKIKNDVPGPGNYNLDMSPLKPVQDSGFYKST